MNNTRKPSASQFGDSDDFVLPVAPPPVPLGHRPIRPTTPPVVTSSDIPSGQGSTLPSHQPSTEPQSPSTAARQPLPSSPPSSVLPRIPLFQKVTNNESRGNSQSTSVPAIAKTDAKSAPWSLVALLGFGVLILIGVLVSKNTQNSPNSNVSTSVFEDNARALAAAQSEIEAARSQNASLELGMRALEDQLAAEMKNSKEKISDLIQKQRTLESNRVELVGEVDRLKRQILASAAKTQLPTPTPRAEPVAQTNTTIHKITGLVYGDFLNVRSGPGANFSAVLRLQNGDIISVVGPAVTNGDEFWMPCLVNVTSTDPLTGATKSLQQKGWVNAHFLD